MRPPDAETGRRLASGVGGAFEDESNTHDRPAPQAGKESMGWLIFCAAGMGAIEPAGYSASPQLSLSRLLDVVGRGTGPGARGRTRASRGERHGRGACPHQASDTGTCHRIVDEACRPTPTPATTLRLQPANQRRNHPLGLSWIGMAATTIGWMTRSQLRLRASARPTASACSWFG